MPWLLITFAVALGVAGCIEPTVLVWTLVFLPAWLIVIPPLEG